MSASSHGSGERCWIELHRRLAGRHSDAADGDGRLAGHLDQQRHLAAQSEAAQLGDAGGQNAGDSGVDGIAALRQHPVTGFHFEVVRRAHHFVNAAHRRKHGGVFLRGCVGAKTVSAASRIRNGTRKELGFIALLLHQ